MYQNAIELEGHSQCCVMKMCVCVCLCVSGAIKSFPGRLPHFLV